MKIYDYRYVHKWLDDGGKPKGREVSRDDKYVYFVEREVAKPRGLGDVLERAIDRATLGCGKRIAGALAKALGKEDCGCAKRRDKLNKMVPFHAKPSPRRKKAAV